MDWRIEAAAIPASRLTPRPPSYTRGGERAQTRPYN
jgi:hypothetical protein